MRTVLLIFLGVVVVIMLPSRPRDPDPTERIPTRTDDRAFPRWLDYVAPVSTISGGAGASNPTIALPNYLDRRSVAVDSRNVVHLVSRKSSGNTSQLIYQTNRFDLRESNGFSTPLVLESESASSEDLQSPDIWVDGSDNLHIVWAHTYSGGSKCKLHYQRKNSAGWYSGGTPVLLNPNNWTNYSYFSQQIRFGSSGAAEIVAVQWNRSNGQQRVVNIPLPQTTPLTPGAILTINGSNPQTKDNALRFAEYGGTLYATWQESGGLIARSEKSGSSWGTVSYLEAGQGPDIAIDSLGNRHRVWVSQSGSSYYAYYSLNEGTGAVISGSDPIPAGATQDYTARILVDSRNQLHVFWGGLAYAARVKNPSSDPQLNPWRLQAPIYTSYSSPAFSMESPSEVAISKTDQIHVVDYRFYTRTMEYGLGVRDEMAMVDGLPGGTMNVTSGNLYMELGLYSTSGVGPSQSLSLVYNSLEPFGGLVAPGWKLNYEVYLVDSRRAINNPQDTTRVEESVTLFLADGRPVHFYFKSFHATNPNLRYLVADDEYGYFDKLERSSFSTLSPQYTLTTKDGNRLVFDSKGRLTQIVEPTGNYLELTWSSSGNTAGLLTVVKDMLGNGGAGRTYPVGESIEYEDATSALYMTRIESIRSPHSKTYTLGYTGNHLSTISYPQVSIDGGTSQGVPVWTFDPGIQNSGVERVGLPRKVLPPRATAAQLATYDWLCEYLPDGRMLRTKSPLESYVQDDPGATETSGRTSVELTHNEQLPDSQQRKTTLIDPRGNPWIFRVSTKFSHVLELYDPTVVSDDDGNASNDYTDGRGPIRRTLDAFGNVTELQDRWGFKTQYSFTLYGIPSKLPHVRDNLHQIKRVIADNAQGTTEEVAQFEYWDTDDGLSPPLPHCKLNKARTRCSVAYGAPEWRETVYTYHDTQFQLEAIQHPNVTRGATQSNVSTIYAYGGARTSLSKVTNEEGHYVDFGLPHSVHSLPTTLTKQDSAQFETLTYDVMGNLLTRLPPIGHISNESPSASGIVLDSLYRVSQSFDAAGNNHFFGYDLDSNVTVLTPPQGVSGKDTILYDKRGFAVSGTTPLSSNGWQQWVDAAGNVRKSKDLRQNITMIEVDTLDRPTKRIAPGGTTIQGAGQGGGGPDMVAVYVHDLMEGGEHKATLTETGTGVGDPTRVTKVTFDNRGRPVITKLPDNKTELLNFYDEQDQLIASSRRYDGYIQTCTVDFLDERDRLYQRRTQNTEPPSVPVVGSHLSHWWILDKAGNIAKIVDPLGDPADSGYAHKTSFVRDTRDRVEYIRDGKGVKVRKFIYGDDDMIREILWPDPRVKEFPVNGESAFVTLTKFSYTKRKEVWKALNYSDKGATYTYGLFPGQVSEVEDALSRKAQQTYHDSTQLAKDTIRAAGTAGARWITKNYADGLLSEIKVYNPQSGLFDAAHKVFWDKAKRLERYEFPANLIQPIRIAHNQYGNPSEFRQEATPGNQPFVKTLQFNGINQNYEVLYSGAQSLKRVRGFDGGGNLTSRQDVNPSTGDQVNKHVLSREVWSSKRKFEDWYAGTATTPWKSQVHTVDNAGNQTNLSSPELVSQGWVPDENNRTTMVTYAAGLFGEIAWTPGGLVDFITLYNAQGQEIAKTVVTYDVLGRRKKMVTTQTGTNKIWFSQEWFWNAADEVTDVIHGHLGAITTYGRNALGELTSENVTSNGGGLTPPAYSNLIGGLPVELASAPSGTAEGTAGPVLSIPAFAASYQLDPGGNRYSQTINGVTTNFILNAASQITDWSTPAQNISVVQLHDDFGNLKLRTTTQTGQPTVTEAYGWTLHHRLSAYLKQVGGTTTVNQGYTYWPDGSRYERINQLTNTAQLALSKSGEVVEEYERVGAGSPTHKNTLAGWGGLDAKQLRIEAGTGTRRHYLTNQVGTLGMTLNETGAPSDTVLTDAFGVTIGGSTTETYAGVAGTARDAESSLHYARERMIDPKLGRFLSPDPLMGNLTTDGYLYASNAPEARIDPQGLQDGPVQKQSFTLADGTQKEFDCTCGGSTFFTMCMCWRRSLSEDELYGLRIGLGRSTGKLTASLVDTGLALTPGGAGVRLLQHTMTGTNLSGEEVSGWQAWLDYGLSVAFASGTTALSSARFATFENLPSSGTAAVLRNAGVREYVAAGRRNLTGVARYDDLAVGSAHFDSFLSAVRSRGFQVRASEHLGGDVARILPRKMQFLYDPRRMSVLDIRHEVKHFQQFKRAGDFKLGKGRAPMYEMEVYKYELALGQKYGFSESYMSFVQRKIDSNQAIKEYWDEIIRFRRERPR